MRAPVYGAQIGLPIISFHVGSYWDRHYRDRTWYDQRSRFAPPSRVAPPRERHRNYSRRDGRDDRRGEWRGDRR